MNRHLLVPVFALLLCDIMQAQEPQAIASDSSTIAVVNVPDVRDGKSWNPNRDVIGNEQIQSDIQMSLADHLLPALNVEVTDHLIDVSGKLANKADKQLAHDIAAAYTDGRKLHDHTKD